MTPERIDVLTRAAHRVGKVLVVVLTLASLYAGVSQYRADQAMKDAAMMWNARRTVRRGWVDGPRPFPSPRRTR